MEVSYIKTQWFRLLVALVCFVMACVYVFKPSPDTSTIEGLDLLLTYTINASLYFAGFIIWTVMSFIDHSQRRLELLEKKQERDDAMFELVQELLKANQIDREIMKKYEDRLKKLEDLQ